MDANSIDQTVNGVNGYISAGNIMDKIIQISTHTYAGSKRAELSNLAKRYDKILWQSETGPLSVSLSGIANNLYIAQRIITDLRELKPVVWCDWQIGANNEPHWSLIDMNYATQQISRNKNYYLRMQYSRFVKQGYTIVESNQPNTIAALNPEENELVVVICNQSNNSQNLKLDFSMFENIGIPAVYRTTSNENCQNIQVNAITSNALSYTAPNQSVTTFIVPVSVKPIVVLEGTYHIYARHSDKVLEVRDGAPLADSLFQNTYSDGENQMWEISPVDGYYKITNLQTGLSMDVNGESLDNGALVIQYTFSGGDNQVWSINEIGEGYYQIINKNRGKSLDIPGESTADYTRVIQYDYKGSFNQQFYLEKIDDVVTGVDKNINEAELIYYPNPFTETITVDVPKPGTISIFDATGSKITERSAIKGSNTLFISEKAGLYQLMFNSGESRALIRIVKE